VQIVENLKYVLGPAASKIDLEEIRTKFEEGIFAIKTLEQNKPTLDNAEVRNRLFNQMSDRLSKKMRKQLWNEVSSIRTHIPHILHPLPYVHNPNPIPHLPPVTLYT
jgi:hypothetical protein